MKKIALHWQIIIGLILGVVWAISSSYLGWSEFTLNWIDPWGKIFINLLKNSSRKISRIKFEARSRKIVLKVALKLLTRGEVKSTFLNIFWSIHRTTIIFFWRKEQGWRHVLNILNMIIWPTENFLEHFEKKIDLKKEGFVRNFQPNFSLIFEITVYVTFPSI